MLGGRVVVLRLVSMQEVVQLLGDLALLFGFKMRGALGRILVDLALHRGGSH